jgi:hypothetical protein
VKESGILKHIKDYCERVISDRVFIWRQNTQGTFIRAKNTYAFHGLPGVPDLVGMTYKGQFLGIEVKRTGAKGQQRPAQKEFEKKCKAFNGIYILTDDLDDFILQLKAVMK